MLVLMPSIHTGNSDQQNVFEAKRNLLTYKEGTFNNHILIHLAAMLSLSFPMSLFPENKSSITHTHPQYTPCAHKPDKKAALPGITKS